MSLGSTGSTVNVIEGQTAELKCPHDSLAGPVRWERYRGTWNLVSLLDHNEDGHFSLAADNRSLMVERARPKHSGQYFCQGRAAGGGISSGGRAVGW